METLIIEIMGKQLIIKDEILKNNGTTTLGKFRISYNHDLGTLKINVDDYITVEPVSSNTIILHSVRLS
ncbi:unnamed protein product, partial [marine sediment metagenome]